MILSQLQVQTYANLNTNTIYKNLDSCTDDHTRNCSALPAANEIVPYIRAQDAALLCRSKSSSYSFHSYWIQTEEKLKRLERYKVVHMVHTCRDQMFFHVLIINEQYNGQRRKTLFVMIGGAHTSHFKLVQGCAKWQCA